jgi:hypothetical protein
MSSIGHPAGPWTHGIDRFETDALLKKHNVTEDLPRILRRIWGD